jgi:hypothetical protein
MKPQPFSSLVVMPLVLALATASSMLPAQNAGRTQKGELAGYVPITTRRAVND